MTRHEHALIRALLFQAERAHDNSTFCRSLDFASCRQQWCVDAKRLAGRAAMREFVTERTP